VKSILRSLRKKSFNKDEIGKYLLYGIGEVFLIIIGILIAVNINESIKKSEHSRLSCTYLNELLFTFEYDIKDVEGNIHGLEIWNPKMHDLYRGLRDDKLNEVDSLYDKFGTVGNFIYFGQRSKTKIEELKYSNISLIKNRELKNKILFYQDESITFIRMLEERYGLVGEDIRKYYTKNFKGYNYGKAFPLSLKQIKEDNSYTSLVYQRLKISYLLKDHYDRLIIKQEEIKALILQELEGNCN
jgi:hypothetical protein